MSKESLKKDIVFAIKEFEKNKSIAEMLKRIGGVPVMILQMKLGSPKISDLREAICELWENGDIAIFGWHYKYLKNIVKEFLNQYYINDDNWLLCAHIGRILKNE